MGVLFHPSDGTRATLRVRHMVGRSRACDLRIRGVTVSAEHAVLWWDGGRWWIRDLGSRNGTHLDGVPLEPGVPRELELHARLGFGEHDGWVLASADAPVARAHALDDGAVVRASDGLLALPSEDRPVVTVFPRRDGSWLAELPEGTRVVADLDVLTVDDRAWRLHLPDPLEVTRDAAARALRLPDVSIRFRVSQHEEHVELTVSNALRSVDLPHRAHNYTLLLLARARVEDEDRPAAERGWVHRDDLARMQRQDRVWLNVQLYRARRQLAELGVEDVDELVQRRAGQIRLAVEDVAELPAEQA